MPTVRKPDAALLISVLPWLAAVVWTLVLGFLLLNNLRGSERQIMDMAYAEARANLNKDISLRRWATEHGGVYVPITERQQPVPWLAHVPGRDVATGDGRRLTLLNPATMLRQTMDHYARDYGIRGRITALEYLNPDNAPDAWEKEQLQAFARGEKQEVWQVASIGDQPYLRHLRAMYMEPGCEKCHGMFGYKVGDIRGATGVNLPLATYVRQIDATRTNLGTSYGLIWLIGLLGIGASRSVVRQRTRELNLYHNIFSHSGEAILVTDKNNRIIAVNRAFCSLTGYSAEEVLGQSPSMLASGRTPRETYQAMWAGLNSCGYWQGELWDRRKDGSIYPKWSAISAIYDDQRKLSHYMAGFTDMSERKASEERIADLARHDPLTRLVNRFELESRLTQALLTALREKQQAAVIFIDMDRFKLVNDSLGHHVGDQLLIEVANRLRSTVRDSDIVARLGGDEFVVVLTGLESAMDTAAIAEKLLRRLGEPYLLDGNTLHSSPSIGISVFPGDGADGATLMKNADLAMYHAKDSGRNNIQYFTAAMNQAAGERLAIERDLRVALERGQLELHFQPQVRSGNGEIHGVEALARWQHPTQGYMSPAKFIPIAEESGLIEQLGNWVLDAACRQTAEWQAEGIRGIRMAVNISAHQLRSPAMVDTVRAALLRHGLHGEDLELEITESVAMADPDRAIGQLTALRSLGVHLSIDDFGTGYSSLAYLKMLPIQSLKLDRTFVRDIESDANDAAICTATLALAHSLGLKVVAEGVETVAQRDFLEQNRCDFLQGYLFGKPEPAAFWRSRWKA